MTVRSALSRTVKSLALGAVRANMIARQVRIPVYALGGIDARNAVRLSGFAGIAAIGALKN